MDFQPNRKKEFKKYGLDVKEMVYATLVSCGWNHNDAYMASHNESISVSKEWIEKQVSRLDDNSGVLTYIADRKKSEKAQSNEDKELLKNATKDETLKELVRVKKTLTEGSDEWLKVMKMIADIKNMKKDEDKTEETTVHFYLPLKCQFCELYISKQKTKKDGV